MRLLQLAKGLGALLGVVKPLNTSPPPVPQFAPVPAAWSDPAQYAATRLPVDEASTLPGAVYHDRAFFDLYTGMAGRLVAECLAMVKERFPKTARQCALEPDGVQSPPQAPERAAQRPGVHREAGRLDRQERPDGRARVLALYTWPIQLALVAIVLSCSVL